MKTLDELSEQIVNDEGHRFVAAQNENTLVHYGVKGMKWGVRKEYVPHPRKRSLSTKLTEKDIRDARHAEMIGDTSTDKKKDPNKRLTEEQKKTLKKLAIAGVATVGVSAAFYMAYKYNAVNQIDDLIRNNEIPDDPFGALKVAGKKTSETVKVDPEKVDALVKAKEAMKDAMYGTDRIFKEGQVFHRVESIAGKDFSKEKGPTYVSFRDDDRMTYLTRLMDWAGTGTRVEVEFKAAKEIRAPSKKKAKAIFEELWKSDPSYKDQLIESVADGMLFAHERKIGKIPDDQRESFKQVLKDAAAGKVKNDPFGQAMYSIVRRGEDTTKFVSKLREAGYDAIEDYFDQGTFSKDPIILLDPSSSVIVTGEESVKSVIDKLTKDFKV